jgi:hypothetical protein
MYLRKREEVLIKRHKAGRILMTASVVIAAAGLLAAVVFLHVSGEPEIRNLFLPLVPIVPLVLLAALLPVYRYVRKIRKNRRGFIRSGGFRDPAVSPETAGRPLPGRPGFCTGWEPEEWICRNTGWTRLKRAGRSKRKPRKQGLTWYP